MLEERSAIAKRLISYTNRMNILLECMIKDKISNEDNIMLLKTQLHEYTHDINFKRSNNMGDVLKTALDFVKRNYEDLHDNYL